LFCLNSVVNKSSLNLVVSVGFLATSAVTVSALVSSPIICFVVSSILFVIPSSTEAIPSLLAKLLALK